MISLKNTLKIFATLLLLMVSVSQAGTSMTYIHTDHLGSPIAATDEAGQVKWTEEYQPFGVQRTNQDSDNSTGFTGHQYDDELELTYMQARWYHPKVGRFMALDPLLYRDAYSFNRYVYANDNPYKYIDPDGRDNWAAYTAHSRATGKSIVELDKCNGCAGAGMTLFPGMGLKDAYDSAEAGEWAEAGINIATEMPWFKAAKLGKLDDVVESASSKVEYITNKKAKLPNIKTDVTKHQFENNLMEDGFTMSTSKDGVTNIFMKDSKKYTTRANSKSTNGPTAEVFVNNQKKSKIRLEGDK